MVPCATVNGSRRGNGSIRVSLAAVLVGAVLAGVASMADRLGDEPVTFAGQPDMLAATDVPTPTTVPIVAVLTDTGTATGTGTLTGVIDAPTTTAPPTTTSHRPTPPPGQTQQVFALVNQARAAAGCTALTDDSRLDTAAQQHSDDMSENDYFSHTTPAGVTFDKREEAAGYPSPGGENIAQGQTSAQQVMTDWMNSPDHRANILNCGFKAIGIGLDTHGWDWTQDFGW